MKHLRICRMSMIAIIGLASLITLTGCSDEDSGSDGSSAASSVVGTGDPDALNAIRAELDKHWLKTSDGWVSQYPARETNAYRQVKEFKFEINSGELSDADKLNKFEFAGSCMPEVTIREYGFYERFGTVANTQWSPWKEEFLRIQVSKNDGQWSVKTGIDDWLLTGTKPDPSAVPTMK